MEIIQQIGSYAGLASVVGLAVLAALYFSQARDVKRLREWAGRAPDRLTPPVPPPRLVARPVHQPVQPPQPQAPPPRPQAPPTAPKPVTPAAGGQPAPARAAPAAVSQDTMAHLPPATAPPGLGGHFAREAQLAREREIADELEARDAENEDAAAEDEPGEDELGDETGPPDGGRVEDEPEEDELEDEAGPQEDGRGEDETGPQDTGNGLAASPSASPPRTASPPPVSHRPVSPPPMTASGQPLPPRPAPPRRSPQGPILPPYEQSRPRGGISPDGPGSSAGRTALAVGAAALLLAVAAFGVLQLTGGEDGATNAREEAPSAPAERPAGDSPAKPPANSAIVPADVTVSVLNGTTVGGLAAELGDKLKGQGFQLGTVTNNTDQQRAESVVLFAPNAEDEAKDVGRRLRIDQREPVDPDSQARAGDASVIVVAGADLNE